MTWERDLNDLPESVRHTLRALHEANRPTPQGFMERRPDIRLGMDLWEAFQNLTPDFNGNLTFTDMRAVLSAFGITMLTDQLEAMRTFRAMQAALRPAEKPEEEDTDG